MLARINRIKKKKDFEIIFKKAKSIKGKNFIFRPLNNNLNFSRCAVVVSQKVSKKAVLRNKVRRRVLNIVKNLILDSQKNIDLVIVALHGSAQMEFDETKLELFSLIQKL